MNWPNILNALLTSAFTTGALATLGFLLKEGVSALIKESISAEYERALERLKSQIAWEEKRKLQAAEIAELFSLWMKHNYYKEQDVNVIRYELQKKYWELALWLDAPVLQAVHKAFESAAKPGITHKEALIAVRRAYVGGDDPILPDELYHWNALPVTPESSQDEDRA
jgi:hypothetical protein